MLNNTLISNCEAYMLRCMGADAAHDPYHIYRVLNLALDIAKHEENVDLNILITACLLHDIGREAQHKDPTLCHAEVGAKMAYDFLLEEGADAPFAQAVSDAIRSHRFRSKQAPQSLEAKILFDADTLDVTGAIGIARSLQYEGRGAVPLYSLDPNGRVITGTPDQPDSFFREYEFKLKNVYSRFYTSRGRELALSRRETARAFFEALEAEVTGSHRTLQEALSQIE